MTTCKLGELPKNIFLRRHLASPSKTLVYLSWTETRRAAPTAWKVVAGQNLGPLIKSRRKFAPRHMQFRQRAVLHPVSAPAKSTHVGMAARFVRGSTGLLEPPTKRLARRLVAERRCDSCQKRLRVRERPRSEPVVFGSVKAAQPLLPVAPGEGTKCHYRRPSLECLDLNQTAVSAYFKLRHYPCLEML